MTDTVKEKAILDQLAATGLDALHYYDHGISVTLLVGNVTDFFDEAGGRVVVARGIAICSITDQFSRKEGRLISLGRALKAYREQRSSKEVNIRWGGEPGTGSLAEARSSTLAFVVFTFGKTKGVDGIYRVVFKSCWMPELTEKEQALLTGKARQEMPK